MYLYRIIILFLILIIPNISNATTWYVRTDGGTSTQCTGQTNAGYTSGSAQPCAFSNPVWALGALSTTQLMAAGDTLIIDDTNHSNGTQAQYMIGLGMGNTSGAQCASAFPYNCVLQAPPSGTDSSHTTKIYGINWNTGCSTKPQIWGTESINEIFDLSGKSNIDVECIEVTDHSTCGFRIGPNQCAENYPSDVGTYARRGFYASSGTNFIFKNVDVHGISNDGMNMSDINGAVFDHVNFDGNYAAGLDADTGGGSSDWAGTITVNYAKTRFNGCQETYPRSSSFNVADYSNCTDQNASPPGYGDGWGFNTTAGNFNITNSEWSHNVQDGLDLLYHDAGDIKIDKSLFEGNNGNQLKFTGQNVEVDNSLLIANCNYLTQAGKVYNTGSWSDCRANGTPMSSTPLLGSTWKFFNDSSLTSTGSSGSAFLEIQDRYLTCNGTETYTFSNDVLKNYNNTWTTYYNGLTGSCATAFNAAGTNHSDIFNFTTSPTGTGVVTTDPKWANAISITSSTNVPNVYLTLTSPGKGNATTNSYWNNSRDYNTFPQNSPIDMGGLQFNSSSQCLSSNFSCINTTDCCSGTCASFVCSGGSGGGSTTSGQVLSGACSLTGGITIQ